MKSEDKWHINEIRERKMIKEKRKLTKEVKMMKKKKK